MQYTQPRHALALLSRKCIRKRIIPPPFCLLSPNCNSQRQLMIAQKCRHTIPVYSYASSRVIVKIFPALLTLIRRNAPPASRL